MNARTAESRLLSTSRPLENGASAAHAPAEVVEEESVKKPTLGEVHLAAPVLTRKSAPENGATDPGLALNGVSGGNANSLSMLTSKEKQPVAPRPVGGDVKPAQLVSSVPPVYPQLARTQRVSGDVTLDALIDAKGKVSSMKVVSGPTLLHQAALDAVRQWKYQPAMLNEQATAMHLTVVVQFRLQ
jgi:TonB family protein